MGIDRVCMAALVARIWNGRDLLLELADPKGVGVIVAGKHGCMRCRGVTTRGDVVTDVMRGQFLMNGDTRHEFLELCRRLL